MNVKQEGAPESDPTQTPESSAEEEDSEVFQKAYSGNFEAYSGHIQHRLRCEWGHPECVQHMAYPYGIPIWCTTYGIPIVFVF
jgi:hypothetical protein